MIATFDKCAVKLNYETGLIHRLRRTNTNIASYFVRTISK